MKLAYPAFAVAKANAKGKCCERRRRSRAQCLSACTGVVDFMCVFPDRCGFVVAVHGIFEGARDTFRYVPSHFFIPPTWLDYWQSYVTEITIRRGVIRTSILRSL